MFFPQKKNSPTFSLRKNPCFFSLRKKILLHFPSEKILAPHPCANFPPSETTLFSLRTSMDFPQSKDHSLNHHPCVILRNRHPDIIHFYHILCGHLEPHLTSPSTHPFIPFTTSKDFKGSFTKDVKGTRMKELCGSYFQLHKFLKTNTHSCSPHGRKGAGTSTQQPPAQLEPHPSADGKHTSHTACRPRMLSRCCSGWVLAPARSSLLLTHPSAANTHSHTRPSWSARGCPAVVGCWHQHS